MKEEIRQNNIVIIDNVIIGINHLVMNSSIMAIFEKILVLKGSGRICFYGEKKHLDILNSMNADNNDSNVAFHPIQVIHPSGNLVKRAFIWFQKLKKDKDEFKNILKDIKQLQPQIVVITTMIPFNLFRFLSKLNRCNEQPVFVFLHGELEFIFKKNPSFGEKTKAFFYKEIFRKAKKHIRFVVLSNYIEKSLVDHKLLEKEKVVSINHPVLPYQRKNTTISDKVVFSHLGVANKRKNSQVLFQLAEAIHKSKNYDNAVFQLIGKVDDNEITLPNDGFVEIKSHKNKSISQEDYTRFIENSNYSLVFLEGEEYVYRISGSVLDSVQFQLPIIAFRHHFTNELFAKGGDIGFLCQSFEEMEELIFQLSQKNPLYTSRYPRQIENLKKLAAQFYVDEVAKIITEVL